MADTYTEHLHLIKQDPDTIPDIDEEHVNLEILDREVFLRGKKFNGQSVGTDGEFHVDSIPYAENLATSASQKSNEEFIIRTSGGEASIPQKGDAWLTLIRGTHRHENYVPQSINMTVTPMARVAPPAITATIDEETFESYVSGEAGTYTISYTTEWDTSPTLYGLTVVNAPVDGDSITIVWDGENDAVVTVNAVPRPTPESIDATIDEDVFVAYVASSSTITLTYSTAWSADPSLYGITVTGSPIAGDVITVVYVKEVRGTIYQSDPQSFISTGWNLYNHAAGYARVIKYSETYGFKISGTYTGLEFSTSVTGSRVALTPVSGYFTIPSDGYVFVSGGNTTDTAIWMTWSDWGSGYNWTGSEQGDFEIYEEHQIDLSTFMAENFPYGLMEVGTVRDEINLNIGIAVSNVQRLAYNATNLANAKASGLQYEYDENYIYIERSNPVEYSVEIDGDYTAFDHGMELFTGTEQDVYSETIYGANLKNKLERDVLTISQQTLTNAQKSQARTNLSAASQSDVDSLRGKFEPTGTKYIHGQFALTGTPSTPIGKIQNFISSITTDSKYVNFDVMLQYHGVHRFSGYIYPDKDYGGGIFIAVDGTSYKWTRLNNVDTVDEIAMNSKFITTLTVVNTYVLLYKSGNCVTIIIDDGSYAINSSGELTVNNDVVILPESFRPPRTVSVFDTYNKIRFVIEMTGKIKTYEATLPNQYVRFSASWVVF